MSQCVMRTSSEWRMIVVRSTCVAVGTPREYHVRASENAGGSKATISSCNP